MRQKIIFTTALLLAMHAEPCCAMFGWLGEKVAAVRGRVQEFLRTTGTEEADAMLDSVEIETEEIRQRMAQLKLREDPAARECAVFRAVEFLNDQHKKNKESALAFVVEQVEDSFIGVTPKVKCAVLRVVARWFIFFVEKHPEKIAAFYPHVIRCFELGLSDEDLSLHARVFSKAIQVWGAIAQHQRAEIDYRLFQEFLGQAAHVALQELEHEFAQIYIKSLIEHKQCLDFIESIACSSAAENDRVRQQLQEFVLQLVPEGEETAAVEEGDSSVSMAEPSPQLRLADLRGQVLAAVTAAKDKSLQSPMLCRFLLQHEAQDIDPLIGLRGAMVVEQEAGRIVELFDLCVQQKSLSDCLEIICEALAGDNQVAKGNAQAIVLELFNRFMSGRIPPGQLSIFFARLQCFIACIAECSKEAAHRLLIEFIKKVVATTPPDSGWHTPILWGYEALLANILDKNIFVLHLPYALELIKNRAVSYKYWGVEEGLLRLWKKREEPVFSHARDVSAEGLAFFLRDWFNANYFELHGQELVKSLACESQAAMRFLDILEPAVQVLLQSNETHVGRFGTLLLRRCAELRVGGGEAVSSLVRDFVVAGICRGSVDFARAVLSFVDILLKEPVESVDHIKLGHIVTLLRECMATNNEETFLGALQLLRVAAEREQCPREPVAEIAEYAFLRARCCCAIDVSAQCTELLFIQRISEEGCIRNTRTMEPVLTGRRRTIDGVQGPGYYANHAEILRLAREILAIVRQS